MRHKDCCKPPALSVTRVITTTSQEGTDSALSFGATWREVFTFILESAGFSEDVQVHWKPVETFDTKEAMEIAYKKIQIGIPLAQVAAEMGYDAAIIANWVAEKNSQEVQAGSDLPGNSESQDLNPDAEATTAVPDGSKAEAA
ncbi:hypothetical protein ACGFX8_13680 [Streptomyces sp. NPDC048362]|uniref:hypothetical protein n=1 Tax=Streptomyces sp. NPDC048362 TaxID=3365539 RepID=UPI003721094B